VAASGLTVIGARDFLIAVNFNLNTTSVRRANAVSFDVREKGRKVTIDGKETWQPGTLKHCKAIGWFIQEYGIAQVSVNLTNIGVTPLHMAFDEVCEKAARRGMRVTGTELVGLVPKRALLEAGKHFLKKQQRSLGLPEEEIIRIAIKSMGLEDLGPFDPKTKILEYLLEEETAGKSLCALTCREPLCFDLPGIRSGNGFRITCPRRRICRCLYGLVGSFTGNDGGQSFLAQTRLG